MTPHDIVSIDTNGRAIRVPTIRRAVRQKRYKEPNRLICLEQWQDLRTGKYFYLIADIYNGDIKRLHGATENELRAI